MAKIESRSLSTPDETRTPDKTLIEIVRLGEVEMGRFTFQPGWHWAECIKPVAGTDSCQTEHIGFVVSGRLSVTHHDGTKAELSPGDGYHVAPDHDAMVVGDEPFVSIEFKGVGSYAKG